MTKYLRLSANSITINVHENGVTREHGEQVWKITAVMDDFEKGSEK